MSVTSLVMDEDKKECWYFTCTTHTSFSTPLAVEGGTPCACLGGLGWVGSRPHLVANPRSVPPSLWDPTGRPYPGVRSRPTGLLTASIPRGGARGREMPPCLCVCALVCLRGWGCGTPVCSTVARHQRMGKCVPGAPGPGREAGEPDTEAAGGVVRLGSQPPRHKDKLPNSSTTTWWHGKTVVRGTTGWQQLMRLRNLLC